MPNLTKMSLPLLASNAEKLKSICGVDTSLLYEELKNQFNRAGRPVEVNFRQMVSWVTLGDQFTHQLHPYPAKLLPHIASFFIRAKSVRGKSGAVLDPFCGSGTVALEASLAGLIPLVADANPFALLLTKVKTHPYDVDELRRKLKEVSRKARRYRKAPDISIINPELWYKKEHKLKLEKIARAISEIEAEDCRDFFRLALSLVAKKVSFSDPAVSVPVRLKPKPTLSESVNDRIRERLRWIESLDVVDEFCHVCEVNINRIDGTNKFLPGRKRAVCVGSDARRLNDFPCPQVPPSLIITSPPYGSAQKYVRASSLSLNWLGLATPKDLSKLEGASIGREHLPVWREELNESFSLGQRYEETLAKIRAVNPLRERITRQYLADMNNAVSEMHRALSDDGHIVFIIGNNTVCGEVLLNDEFLIDACLSKGMTLELSLIDKIKSRGLMTKRNQTASVIAHEAVLVFRKR